MTTEALKDHITQLREWVTGPRQGMGSGLHAEKWPPLTPGARAMLAEHVMWLEQSLAELEAAQQWRPMETAPRGSRYRVLLCIGGNGQACRVAIGMWYPRTAEICGHWRTPDRHVLDEDCLGWLPLPEPPKEGT